MYYWYKFFTYLFYPFAPIYLYFRKLKKKEDPIRYKEKLSNINLSRGDGFLIWFHVASVGEAMSILPLVEICKEDKKINKILITSITLSSARVIEKRYGKNNNIVHQFLPLDVSNIVIKFLNHWKPNVSIFIDSEIWPNLIWQISKKNIPLLLVNARITKKTYNKWKLVNGFANKIFGKFNLCIASNKESEVFLKALGANNIKNYGNLKFSSIKNNLNDKLNTLFLDKIKNRKIWCAVSTHPTEEIFCAETHLKLKKKINNILTIIIPRHIERIGKIIEDLKQLNLKIDLYSQPEKINNETDILLIDAYGEAPKFFNISKSVFLGKSFAKSLIKDSGQNPIEPARLGCKIFHGPNVINFFEIYEYFKTLGVSKEVKSSNELNLLLLEEFKQDNKKNNETMIKIENYGENILNNVFGELKNYINNYR